MQPTPTQPHDHRIDTLAQEVIRLRDGRHSADNHLQSLVLKVTEIQLNLATQDRTLNRLDAAVTGIDRPGLVARVARLESIAAALVRSVWILTAGLLTAAAKSVCDRFH